MPTLTLTERRIMKVWLWSAAGSAAMFLLPFLLPLLMIFLGDLALPLQGLPSLFLYLTVAIAFYAPLRLLAGKSSRSRALLATCCALIVLAAGVTIPVLANRTAEERAASTMKGDGGSPPLLAPVAGVAILEDRIAGKPQLDCSDTCQRLLFSGFTKTVFQSTPQLIEQGGRDEPIIRHRIVPIADGCDNSLLRMVYANNAEWNGEPPPPRLWDKLPELAAEGLCFRSDRVRQQRADLFLVSTSDLGAWPRRAPWVDLTLTPIESFNRWAVVQRRGDRLVPLMRRTHLRYATLAVPLQLDPPFAFATFEPAHWTYRRQIERGSHPQYDGMLGHWLKNDFRILGLPASRSGGASTAPATPRAGRPN